MKNIGSIFTYAVLGTIISTLVLSLSLYGLNLWLQLVDLDFIETLLFGALLSPIDAVATISVLTEMNVIPVLYSLVFGESVLNDAVAIALCSALAPYIGKVPEWITLGQIVKDFVVIIFGSVGIGAVVGLVAAFVCALLLYLYHLLAFFHCFMFVSFSFFCSLHNRKGDLICQ